VKQQEQRRASLLSSALVQPLPRQRMAWKRPARPSVVPNRAWWGHRTGCAIALAGTLLLTLDHAPPAVVSASATPIAIGAPAWCSSMPASLSLGQRRFISNRPWPA